MAESPEFRSSRAERLAALVAGGQTIKAAAATVGLSERHAYRLAGSEKWNRRVRGLRAEMTSAAAGVFAEGLQSAAATIRLLAMNASDGNLKLRAAVKVVELALRIGELTDLEERVQAIEARLTAGKGKA